MCQVPQRQGRSRLASLKCSLLLQKPHVTRSKLSRTSDSAVTNSFYHHIKPGEKVNKYVYLSSWYPSWWHFKRSTSQHHPDINRRGKTFCLCPVAGVWALFNTAWPVLTRRISPWAVATALKRDQGPKPTMQGGTKQKQNQSNKNPEGQRAEGKTRSRESAWISEFHLMWQIA